MIKVASHATARGCMYVRLSGLRQAEPAVAPQPGNQNRAEKKVVVTMVLLGRHRGGYTLLDVGAQLEMVLRNPLTLDGERVAAAVANPNAQ